MIVCCNTIKAQNLVLNPSFEEYFSLPKSYTKIDTFFCKYWYLPSDCSPDYFNKDSKVLKYSVPNNFLGFHPAKDGISYIGLIPLVWDGYMEHITGTLSQPLIKGEEYKVSLFIRHGGSKCYFYVSDLGILFSNSKTPFLTKSPPFYEDLLQPNITASFKFSNSFLMDTSWTQVKGVYKAQGGEKYLTIGIFYEEKWKLESRVSKILLIIDNIHKAEQFYKKNQDVLMINPNFKEDSTIKNQFIPYYFIDDVSVELDTTP